MKYSAWVLPLFLVGGVVSAPQGKSGSKSAVSADALDKTRRKSVYDGLEPDWKRKISVPNAKASLAFTFSEISNTPFTKLKEKLGNAAFMKIVREQGYRVPKGEFQKYEGLDKLPIYYYVRPGTKPGTVILVLVSMGEYQPARYIAHIEGIWRVTGVTADALRAK